MNTLMESIYSYIIVSGLSIVVTVIVMLLRGGLQKLEGKVASILPQDEAVKVNGLLDVIERLTETAVQDANSRIVIGLKQNQLFTKETAASVKQAVVNDVLTNLGSLKEKASELMLPLESIISQCIEKYVLAHK